MSNLKTLLEDHEKQLKQVEVNYHQIQGGINMLKHLISQEETVKEKYTIDEDGNKVVPEVIETV